jgi:hypothetical protein
MYWVEGLLGQLGPRGVDRLMGVLVRKAHTKRNPSAWFNWAAARPWTTVVPDDQIRFVFNGPPPEKRNPQDCGMVSPVSVIPACGEFVEH